MPYVMVPVPEEHVLEVMQLVTKLVARASREGWDEEAVEQLFLRADEGSRSLLSVAATAALAGEQISMRDALRALELRARDFGDLLGPISEAAKEMNRLPLVELQAGEQTGPGGKKRPVRILTMDRDVAELVRAVELKARDVEPHPLDRDVG